ncbi:YraN family protein [Fodinisporobacter ferrooxydans]|uniref:UPF0102 protein LSG31_15720 n=1 Tax=Fodinisporobacter ferrooxydans TaxID=2901836 RepID=A0ABY4CGC5_9BACL|nr:YraN family protein [Alicyclobacillaceae bacterium MYW30-H2]
MIHIKNKRSFGKLGETIAKNYLENKGYQILSVNWRCKIGEIDLIACQDRYLVFVEVKSRTSTRFGSPAEAVDVHKQGRIRKLAEWYLAENSQIRFDSLRFDVIGIQMHNGSTQIRHYEGAF